MMQNSIEKHDNTEKLNKILKKFVILFGISIIFLTIVLFLVYFFGNNKNNPQTGKNPQNLHHNIPSFKFDDFPNNCKNIEYIFKENYIVIYEKSCNIMYIINPTSGKMTLFK